MTDTDIERDTKGRFLSGCKPGPGRPLSSRNRHSENFLSAFADDFERNGVEVIEKVRAEKPDVYLRIAADLLPKEASIDINVDLFKNAANVLEAYRLASDLLGTDPTAGLKRLRRIDHAFKG